MDFVLFCFVLRILKFEINSENFVAAYVPGGSRV